jgi:hypothetical protein
MWLLEQNIIINRKPNAQQRLHAIANFVVTSRSRFARNIIFNGK